MSGIVAVNQAAAASLGLDPVTTQTIVTGLGLIHVLQVYTSAMVTIAVWDWIVCLRSEWRHIWKREWSLVKVLYLFTRYYGLFTFALNLWLFNSNFTEEQCETLHYLIAATCMWVTLGSESILAVRTYAFLGKKKAIAVAMIVMLVGETAFLLYVSIAGVHQTPRLFGSSPCTASDAPGKHIVSGFWLAPVAFDLICTFMTLWKAFSLMRMGVNQNPILKIFLREGVVYFLAVASVNVLNAAFMFQSNVNIQNINSILALVLSQVLCCRLVLNLRAEGSGVDSTHAPSSNSNPNFANTPQRVQHSGFNIPLNRMRNPSFPEDPLYGGGLKVQVDVERNGEVDYTSKV